MFLLLEIAVNFLNTQPTISTRIPSARYSIIDH
jgi:hypothetical protein